MKVAIYARVSSEKQEKQETIQSQLAALRDYARSNDLTVIDEYEDNGYSGELLARPGLDRLRDDARKQMVELILIHSPDRLSRNHVYAGVVKLELDKLGVKIVFLNRPEAGNTPEDKLLAGMEDLIAEYEKTKILERNRRGKLHKANKGILITSRAPYGYRYVSAPKGKDEERTYEKIPQQVRVVRLVFDLFVRQGKSIRGIVRELQRRRIKSPKGREVWTPRTIHEMLKNETYTGIAHFNKTVAVEPIQRRRNGRQARHKNTSRKFRPREEWVPIELPKRLVIIDKSTFELAQHRFRENAERSLRNTKHDYLLRGLLKCGNCGSPMYGSSCHGKLYYRCGSRHLSFPLESECPVRATKAQPLEDAVWDKIIEALSQPKLILSQIDKLGARHHTRQSQHKDSFRSVCDELAATDNEENRLLDAYQAGAISLGQLKGQMGKLLEKREHLAKEKARMQLNLNPGDNLPISTRSLTSCCEQVAKRLEAVSSDFKAKQHIMGLLVKRVDLADRQVKIRCALPTLPVNSAPDVRCIESTQLG
ncbi:recombinase family protein [Candidatus Eisenbacteria bacterium]|uniref:Recombinase family protein n=1 Tax=Eiseniibacteriota bacterium TaxID=2212470 RepID=A0ABV6YN07_UNCEI